MHKLIRCAAGLYFLVSAVQYIPAGLLMLGVESPYGPRWIVPAIPLAQGLVTAVAGFWLIRSSRGEIDATVERTWPSIESFLQLFGVYLVVGGLVASARPLSGGLFFHESFGLPAGGELASAAFVRS